MDEASPELPFETEIYPSSESITPTEEDEDEQPQVHTLSMVCPEDNLFKILGVYDDINGAHRSLLRHLMAHLEADLFERLCAVTKEEADCLAKVETPTPAENNRFNTLFEQNYCIVGPASFDEFQSARCIYSLFFRYSRMTHSHLMMAVVRELRFNHKLLFDMYRGPNNFIFRIEPHSLISGYSSAIRIENKKRKRSLDL